MSSKEQGEVHPGARWNISEKCTSIIANSLIQSSGNHPVFSVTPESQNTDQRMAQEWGHPRQSPATRGRLFPESSAQHNVPEAGSGFFCCSELLGLMCQCGWQVEALLRKQEVKAISLFLSPSLCQEQQQQIWRAECPSQCTSSKHLRDPRLDYWGEAFH